MRNIAIFILFFIPLTLRAGAPNWTTDQNRGVIGGDIIYTGLSTANTLEVAMFKADNMAFSRLILECAVPHKEIKIMDRYSEIKNGVIHAFARASLSFNFCKAGKELAKGDRSIISQKITDNQRLYHRLLEKELGGEDEQESLNSLLTEVIRVVREDSNQKSQKLDAIEKKIDDLKAQPRTVNQTIIHKETHLHGSQADYESCIQDYRELMNEASSEANKSSQGNLAAGPARSLYNKALRKKSRCDEIKLSH